MFSSRFFWKIFIGISAVILFSSLLLGILVTRWIEQDSLEDIRAGLKSQALMLKVITQRNSQAELQDQLKALGASIGSHFTLIDKDGVVIADSHQTPSSMDNHGNRPEVLSARSHGEGNAVRYSNAIGTRMMYYALPIHRDGAITKYVRTSLSLRVIDDKLGKLRKRVFLGAGIAIIIGLIFGYYLALSFSKPIEAMTEIAESISHGAYDEKLAENRGDEFGKLAKTLNHLSENLKIRIESASEEKNKLGAILAGMVEGVIAVDKEGRIVLINDAACTIAGATQDKSIGLPLWEVANVPGLSDILSITLKDKTEVKREIKVVAKEGEKHIEVIASPTFASGTHVSGAVIALHDITELYALERIRRDFVANVSHELKTPITAVRAMIETIIDDKDMTKEDETRFLEKIRNQSIRLSSLVTDVLAIARIESDKKPSETQNIDLTSIIKDVIRSLASQSEERGITIKPEFPEIEICINGDEEAITQAIGNLTENAIKYTPAGGDVCVRLTQQDKTAIVEVKDSGIGIEPVHQQRIFERFYRVDKARSREMGGTGLGLSIVKHVALSHGGSVELVSEPGKGSLFTIRIPLAG